MTKVTNNNQSQRGMDTKVESKTWTMKRLSMAGGGIIILGIFIYAFAFMNTDSSLDVNKKKLTISTVKRGSFQDFISIKGNVQPIRTVYLVAHVNGVVQHVWSQSGAKVQKGDTILTLSNSSLRLNVLQQKNAIYNQVNQTRNARLNIKQHSLSLQTQLAQAQKELTLAKAKYQRKKELYNKDLIAKKTYQIAREDYQYQEKKFKMIYRSYKQDSMRSKQQLRQVNASIDRMQQSLVGVQKMLANLIVQVPTSGQLSLVELTLGQSISQGQRIGQVAKLNNFKMQANIDEYYLLRVHRGLKGTIAFNGKQFKLKVSKVYPVVKNGQFKVDMSFVSNLSKGLIRGQSLNIRLALSDETDQALLLPRGGFYQQTGGSWVYKITDGGKKAVKQPIGLGRQNPNYFEVLSGLQPGDKVIISSYNTFGNHRTLNLE